MNYLKHYNSLCSSRKLLKREKTTSTYYESHHITPKCMGGTDNPSNRVLLTAREHYIAHLLLYKAYLPLKNDLSKKLAFAFTAMAGLSQYRGLKITSRQYETLREAARNSRLGVKVTDTSNYKKPKSIEHRESIRQARLKAPSRTRTTKEKMRLSALQRGNNFSGNLTTSTCPHCNKTGQTNAMKRWHFTNCKQKTICQTGNA